MSIELLINDSGNYEVDSTTKELKRDASVATRCRFRLKCRRGQWPHDPELGSRLYQIETLRQAEAEAEDMVREALQDLLDAGDILDVTIVEMGSEPRTGAFGIVVRITEPDGSETDLAMTPLGGGA